ncbi:Uncharacterized conserved protein YecE, DUF72 family [Dyadobacter soli]|uniref:Uncharacterized conserved protein YecE, DUF72 family n=1 Tax=Dyadobacter soli TaxID=659014 RepID=A0A1G8ANW2_9BACT|nr:DUF72 domain-containing protein [Dyadobacter soli]SDH22553.1 Uncharacterized conserved protein YecE, DUF72 family [Dyadobacter soli]
MKVERKIHIGTSGWSYKHWKGIFYPENVKAAEYLTFYARHFPVSEINNSFYKLPTKEIVEKWIDLVPDGFLFCPKMSRYLSHLKKLHDPKEPLERFFNIFGPYKKHLGPILVQLPANSRFQAEVAEAFYEETDSYEGFRFALEVRHPSWFSEESIGLMKKHGIALVFSQADRFPYHEEITAKDIYLRFHGPTSLYSSSYPDDILEDYAEKFAAWADDGHEVWAFFNNDIGGHALDNARKLQERVDARINEMIE